MSAADFFFKKNAESSINEVLRKISKKKIQNIVKFTIVIIMPILLINVNVFSLAKKK